MDGNGNQLNALGNNWNFMIGQSGKIGQDITVETKWEKKKAFHTHKSLRVTFDVEEYSIMLSRKSQLP
jgi:hypothetical protein